LVFDTWMRETMHTGSRSFWDYPTCRWKEHHVRVLRLTGHRPRRLL